jgi:hypothetical protein
MLLRCLAIILAAVAQAIFVTGQDFAPPEILAADSDSVLEPLAGLPTDAYEAVDTSKVIRGLLGRRQLGCSSSYFACGTG